MPFSTHCIDINVAPLVTPTLHSAQQGQLELSGRPSSLLSIYPDNQTRLGDADEPDGGVWNGAPGAHSKQQSTPRTTGGQRLGILIGVPNCDFAVADGEDPTPLRAIVFTADL